MAAAGEEGHDELGVMGDWRLDRRVEVRVWERWEDKIVRGKSYGNG